MCRAAKTGDQLGEHGIWEKTQFYDGSVRVPLLIRAPDGVGRGRPISADVSLLDLYPTLCECAGLPVPDDLDGRSLAPCLGGGPAPARVDVRSEYCPFPGQVARWAEETPAVAAAPVRHRMIKRGRWKWCDYGPNLPPALFDLKADPGEQQDLAGDPACADLAADFRTAVAVHWAAGPG